MKKEVVIVIKNALVGIKAFGLDIPTGSVVENTDQLDKILEFEPRSVKAIFEYLFVEDEKSGKDVKPDAELTIFDNLILAAYYYATLQLENAKERKRNQSKIDKAQVRITEIQKRMFTMFVEAPYNEMQNVAGYIALAKKNFGLFSNPKSLDEL